MGNSTPNYPNTHRTGNPILMIKQAILLTIIFALAITNASAKGLLGEQYFGISYDIGTVEDIDLWGVSLEYNRQLGSDNLYAYDLHVAASYSEIDESGVDVDGKEIDFGIVVYPLQEFELKPFIAASGGYGEASLLGDSDGSFKYQVTIGGEWKPSEAFTITPYWTYFDYTSLDEGDDSVVGIQGSLWLKEKYNIGFDYSHTSVSGSDLDVVSIIYRQSF